MTSLSLDDRQQGMLAGAEGRAAQLAMRLIASAADVAGATELVPIEMAHISSCHYSGPVSLDFGELLAAEGAQLAVPTHTNASLIACRTPELRPRAQARDEVDGAERLMEIYEALGCTPMWTCAPYQQREGRPAFGQQVVGSESNAVGFFNSVLGARTNKYGDFLDVSAAIVGAVPLTGLHTDAGRLGTHVFRLDVADSSLSDPSLPHLLGVLLGREAGHRIPVVAGMPFVDEDALKAIAAAAASAGGVEMFHVVGVTPEAPTLGDATGGRPPERESIVGDDELAAVRASLSTRRDGRISTVCLGTPHFSVAEFEQVVRLVGDRSVSPTVRAIITTSRAIDAEIRLRGWRDRLVAAGFVVVLDTCTYYPPKAAGVGDAVMTNSAKWATYAPGMLGVDVVFGSLSECIDAAVAGEVVR